MVFILISCSSKQSDSKNTVIPTKEKTIFLEAENETWKIVIEDIGVNRSLKELKCTDCDRYAQTSSIEIHEGYELFFIKANVLNKTSESQTLNVFLENISIIPGPLRELYFPDDNQMTSLIALKQNEKMFISSGIAGFDFARSIKFPPNVQDGEAVEFYFLIFEGDKVKEFYFEDLPAIDLSEL